MVSAVQAASGCRVRGPWEARRARARGWPHAFPLISAQCAAGCALCLLPLAHHPLTLSPLTPPTLAVRKGNLDAMEKAMWEEELALHSVDTAVAEASVLRQRQVDWKFRSDPKGHAYAMLSAQYPFVATIKEAPKELK